MLRSCVLVFAVIFVGVPLAEARGKKTPQPPVRKKAAAYPWDAHPTLEQLYDKYDPEFSKNNRATMAGYKGEGLKKSLKFSRQENFLNLGDIKMDSQAHPVIQKANELAEKKKEHRKATELYRRILKQHTEDMYQIAPEGIFIPAVLYVQRKILRYPQKELNYYRILYDPAAKDIYVRAVRRFSIPDYKDLVRYHLATSYGDDALYALGNAALDNGRYGEARRYYERIVTYHGLVDQDKDKITLDRDQIWVRLAVCYKHLGRDKDYQVVLKKIKNRSEKTVANLLKQLAAFQFNEFAVRQRENRRSAKYDAVDDKKLLEPVPYDFAANRGEWKVELNPRGGNYPNGLEPEALPWATETDLIYKDLNVLYSRSLLTGDLNWSFGPGGSSRDWDFYGGRRSYFYPQQSILVHDGTVFSHMFVYGPSLTAVDQNTGRMLWAKGPMAATTEDEWLDRFQASPAAGRGTVIVPIVHDDIRGRSHIASTAELAAYETRTGKLVWRRWLARISPLKITQSRYPRKIRIFASTPLVNEGVVYHCTNAGVVSALDEQTGDVRWLTRYPQNKKVMDNFSHPGLVWRNEPPVIRGNKLYVSPVDSEFLLCLDTETGRIQWVTTRNTDSSWPQRGAKRFSNAWRMAGFTADGNLCLAGDDLTFLDPETGRLSWALGLQGFLRGKGEGQMKNDPKRTPKGMEAGISGEGNDFWFPLGRVYTQPSITRDGKIYFSMQNWHNHPYPGQGPFNQDYVLNLKTKELTNQRRWYHPGAFLFDHAHAPPIAKRVVNEEEEVFDPSIRFGFSRWNTPFEVDVTYRHIVVRYDKKKLGTHLAKAKDLNTLFGLAEIARKKGQVQEAIRLYEECKPLLPSEEEDRRRNINLRLYPLYMELARWGHQAADYILLEEACRKMGATASNPEQEIRALLAFSELHEKKGNHAAAIRVLQNASRHYWREPLGASAVELGDMKYFLSKSETALKNLMGEIPPPFQAAAQQILEGEKAALEDYALAVANVSREHVVETRGLVARRLQQLLKRSPAGVRQQYEKGALEELKRYKDPVTGERLLWCWPEAGASKSKVVSLLANSKAKTPVEKRAVTWRYGDLARATGLGAQAVPGATEGLKRAIAPGTLPSGAGFSVHEATNEDPDMVRLVLPQKGQTGNTAHLLFAGGRKRRAYGNRFNVMCWDMKANKKVWSTREFLLGGQTSGGEGYEVGFEEIFLYKDLAIVHGRFDVIAINHEPGKEMGQDGKKQKRWHFRVPVGFEIRAADIFGEVLILSGRGSTLALSVHDRQIIWDATEAGEFYAGPYFNKDVVLSVRKSPAEVSFRQVGTGRLLSRLRLPGLTTNRKSPVYSGESGQNNPAAAESAEAAPVACAEGVLAVSDGLSYHLIDLDQRTVRWSRPASKLDPSADASYRMWINGGKLFVLKPYYSVLENVDFSTKTGDMLWRRREGGKKQEKKLAELVKQLEGEESQPAGKAATGLVLSSMTFVNGKPYGIKYEMSSTMVTLVGMDPVSGNELLKVQQKGFSDPEAYVEPSWSKDCVVVRIQDGNKFELWQVDVKAKKIVQRIQQEGYGRLGNYGDASAVWQGPYMCLWAFEKRKLSKP